MLRKRYPAETGSREFTEHKFNQAVERIMSDPELEAEVIQQLIRDEHQHSKRHDLREFKHYLLGREKTKNLH